MRYKDKHITIESNNIVLFDTDRPAPSLITFSNPPTNKLNIQAINIIAKCLASLGNCKEPISLGIAERGLHCIIPAVMYLRNNPEDRFFTVSNNLVINDTPLAAELIRSNMPKFLENPRDLVNHLFRAKNKNYLVFNLDQKESIATAVDFIHKVTGTIAVFNPEYKNQTLITKYVLEKNLIPCENADGSIEIICN